MRMMLIGCISAMMLVGCGNGGGSVNYDGNYTPTGVPLDAGDSFVLDTNSTLTYSDDDTISITCNGGCGAITIYSKEVR